MEGEQKRWLEEEGKPSPSVEGQGSPRSDGQDGAADAPGRRRSSGEGGAPLGPGGSAELTGQAAHDAAVAIDNLDAASLQTLLQVQPRS